MLDTLKSILAYSKEVKGVFFIMFDKTGYSIMKKALRFDSYTYILVFKMITPFRKLDIKNS